MIGFYDAFNVLNSKCLYFKLSTEIFQPLVLAPQHLVGPDVEWKGLDISDPDTIDLGVDPKRADLFYDEVRKYWPGLRDGALQPDYAGIRPKIGHPLQPDGQSIKADFVFDGSNVHGVKGLVNMLGIESPGLTASMSIADTVVKLLSKDGVL